MKRKIIAFFLSVTMCLTLCVTTFADSNDVLSQLQNEGYDIEEYSDGLYIAAKKNENGDATCLMIVDGRIESKSECDSLAGQITHTNMADGTVTIANCPQLRESEQGRRTSVTKAAFTTDGTITYRYYVQGYPDTRTLTVKHLAEVYQNQNVNINGRYQDIAAVVSFFISVFNLPTSGLKAIVATILSRLGIAETARNFLIPSVYVSSTEHRMTWKAEYLQKTGTFYGSKYTVTQQGYVGQVLYGNKYFPLSAFTRHKAELASALHDCINVYWGDGPYDVIWN